MAFHTKSFDCFLYSIHQMIEITFYKFLNLKLKKYVVKDRVLQKKVGIIIIILEIYE